MDYQKIYNDICQRGKDQLNERMKLKENGEYFEGHHIVPESMGGEGRSKDWNHYNITPLTAREHFLVHWMLVRIYPEDIKMSYAFWGMCNVKRDYQERYKPSSRVYQEARKLHSKNISGEKSPMFGRTGEDHPMYGKGYLVSGEKHGMYGKGYLQKGERNFMFGKFGDKHNRSKRVAQYTKDGETLIKIYGSTREAERETVAKSSAISDCCRGKIKSAGGSFWQYV